MSYRHLTLLIVFLLLPATLSLSGANATHGTSVGTSFCKWDFPWTTGQSVKYWVSSTFAGPQFPGGFDDAVARVSYGAGTWNDWGFNLHFSLAESTSEAANGYGRVSQHVVATPPNSGSIASVFIYPNTNCNREIGRPIQQAVTSWNPNFRFFSDCRAAETTWCRDNGYHDIHNVAAHEFGHWFHLGHSPADSSHATNQNATMYGYISLGEWKKRDLTSDDIYAGTLEYGR